MSDDMNVTSVDSYISTLLGVTLAEPDALMHVKHIDQAEHTEQSEQAEQAEQAEQVAKEESITAEDDFERMVDDLYNDCNEVPVANNSSAQIYLSFGIGSIKYLVPSKEIVTVKRYCMDVSESSRDIYDPVTLFSIPSSDRKNRCFKLILKGDVEYSLLADSIEGVVSIRDRDMLLRPATRNTPWYKGITADREYLLLDINTLGRVLKSSPESKITA